MDQETRSSRGLTSYSLQLSLIPQGFIRHGFYTIFKLQVSIPSSLKHHCRFMQMRHSATTSGECFSWLRPQHCWVLWMTAINAMNVCQLPTQPLLLFPAHTHGRNSNWHKPVDEVMVRLSSLQTGTKCAFRYSEYVS